MKLIVDPISNMPGVQVVSEGPWGLILFDGYAPALINQMEQECAYSLISAGMFFFNNEAERLKFVLKYGGRY